MSKILKESLYKFRESRQPKEEINEGLSVAPGAVFREYFLKAGYVLASDGRKKEVQVLVNWAKKLKGLGYPKASKIKAAIGEDQWKKFEKGVLPFMQKQIPSFAAAPGGAASANKGGSVGKDDNERAAAIAKVVGMTPEEIKDLVTRK